MFNIGIVGAGIIANSHKTAMAKCSGLRLGAVCDINLEKANKIAKGTDANVYTDYKEMPKNDKLHGVILNLPHFLHREVTEFFLENHIPVLVEKPMANTVEECQRMIDASRKNNTPLAVGHVQRYFDCYRKLRTMVQTGVLGRLCSVTETRNIDYVPNRPAWFLNKKQAGGGIVMNYCVHTLDKLFYTTGLTVKEAFASGNNFATEHDVELASQVLLKLSDGSSAAFSYCGTSVPFKYETCFYFTDGAVYIHSGGTSMEIHAKGKEPEIYNFSEDIIFEKQMKEFQKFLKGEDNELVTPEEGMYIISIAEKIFENMGEINCL